jgi:pyruvate/2-oxoglutarate/acetoin dehydrogenase E1 component
LNGKSQVTRSGDRLTIVAAGRCAALAEDVADELGKQGNRGVEVVSLGFVRPLDEPTVLQSAAKTRRVLLIQDEPAPGGYAPHLRCVLDKLPKETLTAPPRMVAGADQFLPYWDERPFLPSMETVMKAVQDLMP